MELNVYLWSYIMKGSAQVHEFKMERVSWGIWIPWEIDRAPITISLKSPNSLIRKIIGQLPRITSWIEKQSIFLFHHSASYYTVEHGLSDHGLSDNSVHPNIFLDIFFPSLFLSL